MNIVGQSDYLHALLNICPACHNGLFLFAAAKPYLAIQTFPVPAKITVRNIFHRKKLKTTEERIILGNHIFLAENIDLN